MDKLTGQIANFVNALTYDHLGDEITHVTTQHLIDSLGCAFGAHDCEPAEIGRRLAAGLRRPETAPVSGLRIAPPGALPKSVFSMFIFLYPLTSARIPGRHGTPNRPPWPQHARRVA